MRIHQDPLTPLLPYPPPISYLLHLSPVLSSSYPSYSPLTYPTPPHRPSASPMVEEDLE